MPVAPYVSTGRAVGAGAGHARPDAGRCLPALRSQDIIEGVPAAAPMRLRMAGEDGTRFRVARASGLHAAMCEGGDGRFRTLAGGPDRAGVASYGTCRQGGGSGRGGAVLGIAAPAWLEAAPKVPVQSACPPRCGSGAVPCRPLRNGGAAVGDGRCALAGSGRLHCVGFWIEPASSGGPLRMPPRADGGPGRPLDRRSRRRRLRGPAGMPLSPGFAAARRAGRGHSLRGSAGRAPQDAPHPGCAACERAPSRVAAGR